jgi:hypothetical protein
LFVAFENPVDVGVPIRVGSQWGDDDAIEVALKNLDSVSSPTYVLRGFPGGAVVSSPEAGASDQAAARMGGAVKYAARIVSPNLWTAEMEIPLTALGLDAAKTSRLGTNFTARKTAGPNWVQRRGTGGSTWKVENAGILTIAP